MIRRRTIKRRGVPLAAVFTVLVAVLTLLPPAPICGQSPLDAAGGPSVDLSGLEHFLEVTAILERDREPTAEQWDALFATPGYAVLIEREFRRDFFVENFRLAFMPSRQEELARRLDEQEEGFWAQFLPHYVRARAARDTIQRELEALRELSFVDEAVEKAAALLPGVPPGEYPPISFVIFAPDARGYSPVVIDVLHLMDRGDFLTSFVAHEFHHYYRNRLLRLRQEQEILWVIDQVQAEGIADQVNVGEWFHDPVRFEEESVQPRNAAYLEWYARSPEVIRRMDELFSEMLLHPERRGQLGAELRDAVPLSGHPTGFYMANVIIDKLGPQVLVDEIGNPFRFFLLYSEAAGRKGGDAPSLSHEGISLIRELEARYVRQGPLAVPGLAPSGI